MLPLKLSKWKPSSPINCSNAMPIVALEFCSLTFSKPYKMSFSLIATILCRIGPTAAGIQKKCGPVCLTLYLKVVGKPEWIM